MDRDEATGLAPEHLDVAAYALGVLGPEEAQRYEQHLAGCASCVAELEELLPTGAALADVDSEQIQALDDPVRLQRLVTAVAADRQLGHRRTRVAVTVAAAVAAAAFGTGAAAGAGWLPDFGGAPAADPPAAQPPSPGADGPEVEHERHVATDPVTGVRVEAVLTDWDWGVHVAFELTSLPGPRDCRLVLVRTDGGAEIAGSWQVPSHGYGTFVQPRALELDAATAGDRSDLSELQIVEVDPDGTQRALVIVPM